MKNDVYIVRISIIRFVGHKRGCRPNHSHRQHKKAPTCSRRSDKPPGARHLYPNHNAKFVLCLTQGKFGLLSYAVMQINDTAIHSLGCRDPPQSIVLNFSKTIDWRYITVKKYAPRKVFILENGEYVEITYEELCRREESNPSYKDKLFLPLYGMIMDGGRRSNIHRVLSDATPSKIYRRAFKG